MRLLDVNVSEKFKVVKGNPYFKDLDEKILSEIVTGMRLYSFERDEIIFWEEDDCAGLHIIQHGCEIQGITINEKAGTAACSSRFNSYI